MMLCGARRLVSVVREEGVEHVALTPRLLPV
jgi:hypothetical protein